MRAAATDYAHYYLQITGVTRESGNFTARSVLK
jgi:hypothetical protein